MKSLRDKLIRNKVILRRIGIIVIVVYGVFTAIGPLKNKIYYNKACDEIIAGEYALAYQDIQKVDNLSGYSTDFIESFLRCKLGKDNDFEIIGRNTTAYDISDQCPVKDIIVAYADEYRIRRYEEDKEKRQHSNYVYVKPKKSTTSSSSSSSHSSSSDYDVTSYDDPEDFYDDHEGDFEDYEEAEDYYYDYN